MDVEVSRWVESVDHGRLRAHVEALTKGERHSQNNPSQLARARMYVEEAFPKDLEVRQHAFTYRGTQGVNLWAHKGGSELAATPLLVSAHYDTVAGSRGADDNASGVASLLECARVLASAPLRRAVDFVAFDMEEVQPPGEGLVGSAAFVRNLARTGSYAGVYNLEMVGYTSGPGTQEMPPGFQVLFPVVYQRLRERQFRGDSLVVVALGSSVTLGERLEKAAVRHVPDLGVVLLELPAGIPLLPDAFRSDHASFWSAGIPALMLTDTANFRNPYYHTPRDLASTLDYTFLHRVTRALVAAVAEMAVV